MKYLKMYEEFKEKDLELISKINEYLLTEFPSDWWNSELNERIYDYISMDEVVGDGDEDDESTWEYESYEDAYKNLCSGGAIEYDIMEEIAKELKEKFHLTDEQIENNRVYKLIENHMVNMCSWYDSTLFGEEDINSNVPQWKDPFDLNTGVNKLMASMDKYSPTDDGHGTKL